MASLTLSPNDVFERLGVAATGMVAPSESAFPHASWSIWKSICAERWNFFTGQVLHTDTYVDGKQVGEKYPLHINPIRTFCLKHAYTLFGEVPDSSDVLVQCRVRPKSRRKSVALKQKDEPGNADASKVVALEIEEAIEEVYQENNMRALMMENALLSQFLGGCVFKVSWCVPDWVRPSGIRIERIIPDYFWGVPDGSDMWNLREAWVVSTISAADAKAIYNVDVRLDDEALVQMIEHWTRSSYKVTINDQVAYFNAGQLGWIPMAGINDDGFVPFIYIPHERAGNFHGLSIVDALKDVELEYNARMADAGDIVHENSKLRIWMANVAGSVKRREVAPGIQAIDLGSTGPGGDSPEVGIIQPPSVDPETNHFNKILFDQMRRDGNVPPVADGEDEGSQRSALTLAFRMWPLTSHIRTERQFWGEGLNLLAEMILRILARHNPQRLEAASTSAALIGPDHLGHKKAQIFYPMIPRDREQLVNEMVIRSQTNHVSPQHALEMYGDVDDINQEIDLILEWLQRSQTTTGESAPPPETQIETPKAAVFTE